MNFRTVLFKKSLFSQIVGNLIIRHDYLLGLLIKELGGEVLFNKHVNYPCLVKIVGSEITVREYI